MDIGLGSYFLGFGAGVLSTLSPCVLPLIPLIAASAMGAHRLGVVALSLGLAVSFTAIGLIVATAGVAAGLSGDGFRLAGAIVMGAIGVVLLSPSLQARFAGAAGGMGDAGHRFLDRLRPDGLSGQLIIGLVLGAVWSPCVGPTLGAASLLASRQEQLADVGAIMLLFGIGAAVPLMLLGSVGRSALGRWRTRLAASGHVGKSLFGGLLLAFALLVGSGLDKEFETLLVQWSPAWLTDLTTRF